MSDSPLAWRRNVLAVTAATFVGFTGFTLVMPFLPLFIRQLGVSDVGEIALWTGAILGVTPALTAIMAPVWGRLSDRFGRKIMVRSLASCSLVMAAIAFVSHPWQVFALRAVLGPPDRSTARWPSPWRPSRRPGLTWRRRSASSKPPSASVQPSVPSSAASWRGFSGSG